MSPPDVDSELDRLLAQTRAGTEPAPAVRARIRTALDQRLASTPPAAGSGRLKLLALVGVGAVIALGVWRSRAPASAPAPRAVASAPAVTAPPPAPPPTVAHSVAEPRPAPSTTSAGSASLPPRVVVPGQDPAAELRLIAAMQSALRGGSASLALSLAEQHAKTFPRGALVQEREGVRAVAGCRLADPTARAALGAAFLARYPSSPYTARVKDACR